MKTTDKRGFMRWFVRILTPFSSRRIASCDQRIAVSERRIADAARAVEKAMVTAGGK